MTVKFMQRIPTVDYGYVEIAADNFVEFVEADASVRDLIGRPPPVTEQQAVQNLQNQGLVSPNPGRRGPVQDQGQQGWQSSVPEEPPAQEYCTHGPKKWVPPGVSKSTQKPYNGFWACPAPRGQQCR